MSNYAKPSLKEQQIWVMSYLSNINAGKFYVQERNLQANAEQVKGIINGSNGDTTISGFLGSSFNVVWGPVLANERKTVSVELLQDAADHGLHADTKVTGYSTTNMLYVAKGRFSGATVDSYVIATAGTNVNSPAGWFQEDFEVRKTVAWPPAYLKATGVPASGHISEGTDAGLKTLWNMHDPSTGKSLYDFMSGVLNSKDSSEVLTCGHSLGGALSPVLALALINKKPADSGATIATYPTAGATSGNPDFASYATGKFVGNYHSRVNNFDIVPHGWAQQNDLGFDMRDIANIYAKLNFLNTGNGTVGLPASAVINGFSCWAKSRRKPYIGPENQYARIVGDMPFSGSPVSVNYDDMVAATKSIFDKSLVARAAFYSIVKKCGGDTDNLVNLTADFLSFAAQAGAQHTTEYMNEFLSGQPKIETKLGQYISLKDMSLAASAEAKAIVIKLVQDVSLRINTFGCC